MDVKEEYEILMELKQKVIDLKKFLLKYQNEKVTNPDGSIWGEFSVSNTTNIFDALDLVLTQIGVVDPNDKEYYTEIGEFCEECAEIYDSRNWKNWQGLCDDCLAKK